MNLRHFDLKEDMHQSLHLKVRLEGEGKKQLKEVYSFSVVTSVPLPANLSCYFQVCQFSCPSACQSDSELDYWSIGPSMHPSDRRSSSWSAHRLANKSVSLLIVQSVPVVCHCILVRRSVIQSVLQSTSQTLHSFTSLMII